MKIDHNNKTKPIIGEVILENFKSAFFEKYQNENGSITGIQFWPSAEIEEAYNKASAEIGGENEAQALKVFYSEMLRFYRMASYIEFDPEEEHIILSFIEKRETA